MSKINDPVKRFVQWVLVVMAAVIVVGILLSHGAEAQEVSHPGEVPALVFPGGEANYVGALHQAEKMRGIPYGLLVEVARSESSFRYEVINCAVDSPAGARGLMQIIPKYHPIAKPCHPLHAIGYASAYLSLLYERYDSWYYALAAYNWGPLNTDTSIKKNRDLPGSVHGYAMRILNAIGLKVS